MTKKEILAMTNVQLIAHALNLESQVTKEANSRRGVTKKTRQNCIWTYEELAKRFEFDLKELASLTGADHWWNDK